MFFLNSSFMDKGVSYFRGNEIFLTTWFFPGKEACFPAKGSGVFSRLYFLRNSLCIFRTTLSEIRFASFVPAAFCFAKRQGPKFALHLSYQLLFVLQKDRVRNIIAW